MVRLGYFFASKNYVIQINNHALFVYIDFSFFFLLEVAMFFNITLDDTTISDAVNYPVNYND